MGSRGEIVGKIAFSLFIFILLYFSFQALTTTPIDTNDVDSLRYHIPIAESIADGQLLSPPILKRGLGYYPAVGESILALFII